jgi:hypothetical protein
MYCVIETRLFGVNPGRVQFAFALAADPAPASQLGSPASGLVNFTVPAICPHW